MPTTPSPTQDELPIRSLVDKPIAYRMAVALSLALGLSWLGFLACLGSATLPRHGLPLTELAFQGALLMGISGLFLVVGAGALVRLALLRHPKFRSAAIWCITALAVPVTALAMHHRALAVAI